MTDDVQVSFRCDPELRRRLKVAAVEAGVTLNELLVDAVERRLAPSLRIIEVPIAKEEEGPTSDD